MKIMKCKDVKRVFDQYIICPNCGNDKIEIKDNKLVSGVLINKDSFERVCKCGFKITIKEF